MAVPTPPNPAPPLAPPPLSHAHHPPPLHIRECHKKYQKTPVASLPKDEFVLDFDGGGVSEYHKSRLKPIGRVSRAKVGMACRAFEGKEALDGKEEPEDDILIYEHDFVPGDFTTCPYP